MTHPIDVGDQAPGFSLLSHEGRTCTLTDLLADGPLVLFFYPKDNTSGCTAEACAFRDQHEAFAAAGARVVGISSDSASSHQEFATAHRLPYTLLSDVGGKVREAYGVKRTMGLIPGRVTYIIDASGTVQHVFNSQFAATRHVTEALATVQRLRRQTKVRHAV